MAKQHEILAVEPSKKAAANKLVEDARKQFHSKADRYDGLTRTYETKVDGGDIFPPESKPLGKEDNVPAKLNYLAQFLSPFWDVAATKEATNQIAKADVVIDGEVMMADIPATTLLFLEKELKAYRGLLDVAPTLDPAYTWGYKSENKYYETPEVTTLKTSKEQVPIVLAPATDKHPAQTQLITKDMVIGQWNTKRLSGALTVRDKADLIARADELINAVTQARMRANEAVAIDTKIGEKIFEYLNAPIASKL